MALVIGLSSILTGFAMLAAIRPIDFPFPNSAFLLKRLAPWMFLLSGALLVVDQIWKLRQRTPLGRFGRSLRYITPLFSALFFFALLFLANLPEQSWTLVAYYGIFGLALAIKPWFRLYLDRAVSTSLRTRLAFVLSAAMAVPLILTAAITSNKEENLVKAEVLARQESQAVALANGIADYVNLNRSALVALAGQPGLMSESSFEQRQQLQAFIQAFPDIAYFSTFDTGGNLIATYDNGNDVFSYDPYILKGETVQNNIMRSGYMQRPLFGFGVPTHDSQGDYTGLASFALSSVRVANFLKEQASALEGEIYLVDQKGRVIAHPNELMAASFADLSKTPPVKAMLADANPTGSSAYLSQYGEQLAGYARVPHLNWGVVVERPASKALAGVYAGREIALMLLLISSIATSFAGIGLASVLVSPLNALSKAMNALATGQNGASLPKTSFTEMQHLAVAFGRMRNALVLQTNRREQTLLELREAREDLETRVVERTSALRLVNMELKRELENRDRLEAALVEKTQRISDILDSISDGFISLDKEWKIIYTNRRATPDGLNQEDLVGKSVLEIFPSFATIIQEAGYLDMAEDEIPSELELNDPGSNSWYNARIFISPESTSIYWVDTSESKRAELEREQRQVRARLLVEISTRILAINTIEGLLQTLAEFRPQPYRFRNHHRRVPVH